jgi:hypothetical protein
LSFAGQAGRLRSAIVTARKNGVHEVPAFGTPYRRPRRQSAADKVASAGSGDPASIALMVGIAFMTCPST